MALLRRIIVAAAAMALLHAGALAQSAKVYRVGLVTGGAPETGVLSPGVVRDFAQRGYVVDRNIVFERRAAQGKLDRLPGLIDELVAAHVDVIITSGYPAALAAKQRAGDIPIVVTNSEAVPSVRNVAVLWNADDFGMTLRYQAAEVEAKRLGMLIMPLGVHAPDDFDTAFAEMTKTPPDAILMVTDVLTILNRKRVMQYADEHRLPAIYEFASLVHDGGLMAYGADIDMIFDRAAGLADRILKGAKPGDLPLELPTRFQFAINLKTAKAIGLTFPEAILLRADDVIE